MIKSMTGYGRHRATADGKDLSVEVKSVNSRYLDVNIKLGRLYAPLEDRLKQLAGTYISRGKLDVYVTVENISGDRTALRVNTEYLESYVALLRQIKEQYGLEGEVGVQTVAARNEIFLQSRPDEDLEALWELLCPVARQALEAFVAMRRAEGEKLREDLLRHLETLEGLKQEIARRAPAAVAASNERMRARIAELLGGIPVDEGRLLTECAVFADKADISEELARLESHFSQFRKILREDRPVGRKLDFLVQELNREVNTVGSKANDTEMAGLVIEAKSVIEKLREQIQNIE